MQTTIQTARQRRAEVRRYFHPWISAASNRALEESTKRAEVQAYYASLRKRYNDLDATIVFTVGAAMQQARTKEESHE